MELYWGIYLMSSSPIMERDENMSEESGASEAAKPAMTQVEYMEIMDTHHKLIQTNSAALTQLTETLKSVRESKAPLTEVKTSLQEEINSSNKAINTISEEVTFLKQKLRYHSVRQIHDNIERLKYQLRNNNYKPREEQKILDEISMLQRSVRTLREYEAKQAENKKYRNERVRLIKERNENFARIRKLYSQEDQIKRQISSVRDEISQHKKGIEQLRQLRPKLEQEWALHQQRVQAARLKRYEEKLRLRQEQIQERHEERRKLWEEYEASREPYEEEKNLCRVLISYLQSSTSGTATPSTPASSCSSLLSTSSTPAVTPATTPSSHTTLLPPQNIVSSEAVMQPSPCDSPSNSQKHLPNSTLMHPPESSGSFYCKPKVDEEGFLKVNKRGKAKARREQRLASRVKDLPHTPDVLAKFTKLAIHPPKNTDEVPAVIISLQDCLQRLYTLSVSEAECASLQGIEEDSKIKKRTDPDKCAIRPKSLQVKGSSIISIGNSAMISYGATSPCSPAASTSKGGCSNSCPLPDVTTMLPGVSWSGDSSSNVMTKSDLSTCVAYNGISPTVNSTVVSSNSVPIKSCLVSDLRPEISKVCTEILSSGNSDSFFSVPMSYANNFIEPNNNNNNINININNNTVFTYAAVTAKVVSSSLEISD